MKFLNKNSMSKVLINKLVESENSKSLKESYYVKVYNSYGTDIDTYETSSEQEAIDFAENQKKEGNRAVVYNADTKEALYDYDPNNLEEDAWDDNFVISVIQSDGVYWKRKSDGKEIKTSFDVFKEPTDPTEWKSEEELSQYVLEEDLGPAQKVYNKKVLNNKKQVNTAKNSATNLNEDSYESGIFYEIEEALREAGLNPVRFNENGIMTNNIGWTVRGEDGTEQQITCDGSYLDDEEINQ